MSAAPDLDTGVAAPTPEPAEAPPRSKALVLLPLALFAALAGLFLYKLESGGDPAQIPSVLIGRKIPDFTLPPLEGLVSAGVAVPGLTSADLKGRVTLVNVWASWCIPCRQEHPILKRLAEDGRIRLVGINYKDDAGDARRFLGSLGNPYAAVGADVRGRAAIDWGVYGVPETFVVAADGTIAYKYIGPLSDEGYEKALLPQIDKALQRP